MRGAMKNSHPEPSAGENPARKPARRRSFFNIFNLIRAGSILLLAAVLAVKLPGILDSTSPKILTASVLTEAIDIDALSTAEFSYAGIAQIYADAEETELLCRVRYNATVKAGISMAGVQFEIDNEKKTVTATLPELQLTVNIDDEKSFSFIPSEPNIPLRDIIEACEQDAEREALASAELLASAKSNAQSVIGGLLYPLLLSREYTLLWN